MAQLAISVAMMAASTVVEGAMNAKNRPAVTQPKAATSSYGHPIPKLYGTKRLPGTLIWNGDFYEVNSSGKGESITALFGPAASWRCDFAYAFCAGPATSVLRIWADGNLVYDAVTPQNVAKNANVNFIFYNGSEDQMPDPTMAAWVTANVPEAPGQCPAYRGLVYIMFPAFTISNTGFRIPSISAEISNSAVSYVPSVPIALITTTGLTIPSGASTAVDWLKNVTFVTSNSTTAGMSGLTAISLSSGTEFQFVGIPSTTVNTGDPLVVMPGGNLYSNPGGGNSSEYYMIDSNSLVPIASVGGISSSLTNAHPTATTPASYVTSTQLVAQAGAGVIVCLQGLGQYAVMDANLNYVYGAPDTAPAPPPLPYNGPGCLSVGVADVYDLATGGGAGGGTTGGGTTGGGNVFAVNFNETSGTDVAIVQFAFTGFPFWDEAANITFGVAVVPIGLIDRTAFMPGSTATGNASVGLAYDISDNTLIISAFGGMVKWDPNAQAVVWQRAGAPAIDPQSFVYGTLGFFDPILGGYTVIDTRTGATKSNQTITEGLNPGLDPSAIWDGQTNSLIANWGTAGYSQVYLGGTQSVGYPVADIVQDVACNLSGLPATAVDTSLLTATTAGFTIEEVTNGKDTLEVLMKAFLFDIVESDYKLKAVPRGQSSVVTIPQSDLGSAGKALDGNYWLPKRSPVIEIPTVVHVKFSDADNDYLENMATKQRNNAPVKTVATKQQLVLDLPVALHQADAVLIAQSWLWTLWTEIRKYETMLGWKYAYLDPSDNITVSLDDGSSYTVRIDQIESGANLTRKLQCVGEDQQTYTQTTTVQNTTTTTTTPSSNSGYARPFWLNVPLLRTTDDTGGTSSRVYYGAGAFVDKWAGGVVYTSTDGTNFSEYSLLTKSVTWGTATKALGSTATPFSTDNVNTLTIALGIPDSELVSVSYLEMLNGANAALLGNEIIQFMSVTTNSDGTLTLSGLLRGRQGTEWAVGTHKAGDTFILLDTSLMTATIPLTQIGATRYAKIVPLGGYQDTAPVFTYDFQGLDLKPYAPVNFTRTASGSDLLVSWVRRTRFDTNLMDGVGVVPLGEATESYDAYVLSTPYNGATANYAAPSTYVRAFTGLTGPSLTYTASEMAADGFNPATGTLHVVVFQNSAAIGHGWPGAADL